MAVETVPGALCRDAMYVEPAEMAAALAQWAYQPATRHAVAMWLGAVARELNAWEGGRVHALECDLDEDCSCPD